MFILILFAFLAGFVTILSPCILPVLPIVLSGSLSGGKRRPLGIVTGFIISFTFFTLALSAIVKATGLSADSLRTFSVAMIGFFGISLLIPQTQLLLEKLFTRLSGFAPKSNSDTGFWGGVLLGLSLGLIWTPCVGPILASVITVALTGSTSFSAFLITLSYSLGTGIPMLAITYGGRQLLHRVPWLLANTAKIQKGFGVVMIAMAVAIFFNVDRQFQTIVLKTFPEYGTGLTKIEDNQLVQEQLGQLGNGSPSFRLPASSLLSDMGPVPNPSFAGGTRWIGSEPLSFETNLKGKVVLVDFWTYSCINCIRTLPYLRSWYDSYKDKGFVIVGVHSPEFEFEKKEENVKRAMQDLGVTWPVVQDNNLAIWNSYQNQYWPAHYLFDAKGRLRETHFGEGNYKETEESIQTLLKDAGQAELPEVTTKEDQAVFPLQFGERQSPETYLGYERASGYTETESEIINDEVSNYNYRDPLSANEVGIRGSWKVENERITSASDTSTLSMNFYAGKMFLVMGGKNAQGKSVTVKLDGKDYPVPIANPPAGGPTSNAISIDMDKKYDIFDSRGKAERHTVELTIPTGISAYAFTFGE